MNKLSKLGVIAISLLFLSASSSSLAGTDLVQRIEPESEQEGPTCPLEPQIDRTIVLFNTNTPLVAHESLAEALAGPIDVSLPTGIYNITASSFDYHNTRDPIQNQLQEQFYLRLSNGQTTNRISDLPENSDTLTEQIDANFAITSAVTSLTAQHTEYPDPGSPNSIFPVCIAFDDITPIPTPEPSPIPSPTPTPETGQGGPGDETDCCIGPDPEPEATVTPKVLGTQTEVLTPPTPTVAGTLTTFPSSGLSIKAAVRSLFTTIGSLINGLLY